MGERLYLLPKMIARCRDQNAARPLAGSSRTFAKVEAICRNGEAIAARATLAPAAVEAWAAARDLATTARLQLERLSAPRPPFAGLELESPHLMGIINVTPDSFSDGGDRYDAGRAVADGLAMREEGAAILDVGGESTRPGATPIDAQEEVRRVLPVVRSLAAAGCLVSIDSRRARVVAEALAAGAAIINDVTALAGDPESLSIAARAGVPVVLMHMQGDPGTMQKDPQYADAALDVYDFLEGRVAACREVGIPAERIAIDPGIGFGKTVSHNLRILDYLALFHGLGTAVLLGASRKSFIGRLSRGEAPKERLPGSLAAALAGVARGVQLIRVHDVAETCQALDLWRAIEEGG